MTGAVLADQWISSALKTDDAVEKLMLLKPCRIFIHDIVLIIIIIIIILKRQKIVNSLPIKTGRHTDRQMFL